MLSSLVAPRAARRLSAVAAAALAFGVTACLDVSDPDADNRFGSITIRATAGGTGPYRALPTAIFFTGSPSTLPNSAAQTDQCGQFPLTGEQLVPGTLVAGAQLALRVGSQNLTLTESASVPRIYTMPSPGEFVYNEGDTARVTLPGAAGGFPGSQISLRLAEAVRLGPLTRTEVGEDYPISWRRDGDARSGIIISMRYASASSTTEPNTQLLCLVRDNGSYTIPGGLLTEWYTSNPAFRSINILRWRTNTVEVDPRSTLYIVSTIDTTVVLPN
jgi:hypothetical protein